MRKSEIDFVCALVGRKQDVLLDKLPATYGSTYSDEVWTYISEYAEKRGVDFLNLRSYLLDNYREKIKFSGEKDY